MAFYVTVQTLTEMEISNSESQVLSVFKIFVTLTQFHDEHLGGKIMCQYGQKRSK